MNLALDKLKASFGNKVLFPMLFEMAGVGEDTAREAIRLASHKLPVKTKFVLRESLAAVSSES